jgi:hypothetical protein
MHSLFSRTMLLVKRLENQGCNHKRSCDERKSDKTLVVCWGVNCCQMIRDNQAWTADPNKLALATTMAHSSLSPAVNSCVQLNDP